VRKTGQSPDELLFRQINPVIPFRLLRPKNKEF
jgi:hypothetical protein